MNDRDIVLAPELRHGWYIQEFGKAMRADMQQNYPPSAEEAPLDLHRSEQIPVEDISIWLGNKG